jgi:hypothetical protein
MDVGPKPVGALRPFLAVEVEVEGDGRGGVGAGGLGRRNVVSREERSRVGGGAVDEGRGGNQGSAVVDEAASVGGLGSCNSWNIVEGGLLNIGDARNSLSGLAEVLLSPRGDSREASKASGSIESGATEDEEEVESKKGKARRSFEGGTEEKVEEKGSRSKGRAMSPGGEKEEEGQNGEKTAKKRERAHQRRMP